MNKWLVRLTIGTCVLAVGLGSTEAHKNHAWDPAWNTKQPYVLRKPSQALRKREHKQQERLAGSSLFTNAPSSCSAHSLLSLLFVLTHVVSSNEEKAPLSRHERRKKERRQAKAKIKAWEGHCLNDLRSYSNSYVPGHPDRVYFNQYCGRSNGNRGIFLERRLIPWEEAFKGFIYLAKTPCKGLPFWVGEPKINCFKKYTWENLNQASTDIWARGKRFKIFVRYDTAFQKDQRVKRIVQEKVSFWESLIKKRKGLKTPFVMQIEVGLSNSYHTSQALVSVYSGHKVVGKMTLSKKHLEETDAKLGTVFNHEILHFLGLHKNFPSFLRNLRDMRGNNITQVKQGDSYTFEGAYTKAYCKKEGIDWPKMYVNDGNSIHFDYRTTDQKCSFRPGYPGTSLEWGNWLEGCRYDVGIGTGTVRGFLPDIGFQMAPGACPLNLTLPAISL